MNHCNNFCSRTFPLLNKKSPIVYSPLSAFLALSCIYHGAAGETEKQLSSLLGERDENLLKSYLDKIKIREPGEPDEFGIVEYSSSQDIIDTANILVIKKDSCELTDSYSEFLKTINAEILSRSFDNDEDIKKLCKEINKLVSDKTHGKIDGIIEDSQLNDDLKLILINTLYLKMKWAKKFPLSETRKSSFNTLSGNLTQVDMMHLSSDINWYYEDDNIQLVQKLYSNCAFGMGFILPKNNYDINSFSLDDLKSFVDKTEICDVDLYIPRFKQENKIDLKTCLKQLGVNDIFSLEADLPLLSAKNDIYVSDICQRVVVEVNEESTEAAAVTSSNLRGKCRKPSYRKVTFKASRSFLYYIKMYETGTLLFVGLYDGK